MNLRYEILGSPKGAIGLRLLFLFVMIAKRLLIY